MGKITMNTEKNAKTIEEAFEDFQKYNTIKGLTENTINDYENSYKLFTKFYDEKNLCSNINLQIIQEFILNLKRNNKVNDISINTYLGNLRVFVNYCIKWRYTDMFDISLIKADKTIKITYTDREIEILLRKPDMKKCKFSEYRDWVVINYLVGTGNRISTVINIKIEDIDCENNTIILKRTKNRNQQIIPITNTLKTILLEYLNHRKGNPEDYLFCNTYGKQLTRLRIASSIRNYNNSRGVKKTSLHLFRHYFAKSWIINKRRPFKATKINGLEKYKHGERICKFV